MEISFKKTEQKGGYTPRPQGTYDMQVDSIKSGTSKKGNEQLEIKCKIVGGKHDGGNATLWMSLTEQSTWKLQQFAEACGVGAGDGEEFGLDTDELLGCYFQCDNVHREYNGKMNDDWKNFRASPLAGNSAQQAPTSAPAAANGNTVAAAASAAATGVQGQEVQRRRRIG